MKPPDILNSKIKKIRIELPHYSFSHSSSGDSPHAFIGRDRIRVKLRKVIEDSPDEPGVYLIAGNRGVGKTSLVSWVINETSLKVKSNFFENLMYLILLLFFVAGTQFCTQILQILNIVPEKLPKILVVVSSFVFISSFILLCCFNSYRHKMPERNVALKILDSIASAFKELGYLINPYNPYGKTQYLLKVILVVSFTQLASIISKTISPTIVFFVYLAIVLVYKMLSRFVMNELHKNNQKDKFSKKVTSFLLKFKGLFLVPIWNYIKNHNRLYLRINFGHKLNDEKDILRLIARTLSTEYNKFCRSFRRMLPRRVLVFGILVLFAYLFTPIVERQEFYNKLIKANKLYKASSQVLLDDPLLKGPIYLDFIFLERDRERLKVIYDNEDIKVSRVSNILLALDQLVFEITKIVKKAPKFFLEEKIDFDNVFFPPINYLSCLLFFFMYLFCKLLSRWDWITHFFITHQIIKQRLKNLNRDITHSTEREYTIRIGKDSDGSGIGTKAKKSRNVADAREIEKELQDILNDIQRIPVIMCRPNLVIVFDELDKVEPGDASFEKGNPQTKASLFSIHATRERQTEILRILSNMKYFLSTAKSKFIFIAGREMFDIHLADVSERNNYIGSIFNVVILVPSFLTDHQTGKKSIPQESSIASLPEEFVCRRLIPHDYPVESYNLKNYQKYLKNEVFCEDAQEEKIQKIIAVLQQFIIYLAHVSKGAPKKMMQLFESFVEIHIENGENRKNTLFVQRYQSSRHFLSFNYYKQYTLGIIAHLITPIFYRLAESNIKELSDKLLVSSLRFVDFLFKFHKHSFSWKHLDMSPEMLEVNRAPELKSVVVDLLNYLLQVHINKSNFSLSDYKFDGLIANEIFAMAKTDEVFSALFSFSLDETLPLKKHYQDLLEKAKKEYQNEDKNDKTSDKYIDAISSLQGVLGDLHYYDDELEEAEAYYKSAVQALREMGQKNSSKEDIKMTLEQLYVYIRNMLRLGIIYEKRKQYDFAYLTYGELCKRIIQERDIPFNGLNVGVELRKDNKGKVLFVKASSTRSLSIEDIKYYENFGVHSIDSLTAVDPSVATLQPLNFKNITPSTNDMLFKKMTYEGLKMLYLPFIAKLQIIEQSHIGGITHNHLKQLDKEFVLLTFIIDHEEAKLLEAEFFSRVADILYYKNSDLKCKHNNNRKDDRDEDNIYNSEDEKEITPRSCSCTACYYYHKAFSILLNKPDFDKLENKGGNTVIKLLCKSVEQLKKNKNNNYNMKFYTILARILSDWGNVFFSCDTKNKEDGSVCYICEGEKYNTITEKDNNDFLENCVRYLESERENGEFPCLEKGQLETKKDIAFVMYSVSSVAYRKASLYKRSSYQIYKMLRLFKDYEVYKCSKSKNYIKQLSERAIHYLWYVNDDLNVLELNKRKKDFDNDRIDRIIPLQYLLVDNEITRVWIMVKELELKSDLSSNKCKEFYDLHITSPYKINYSIVGHIFRLWLKSKVNYNVYQQLIEKSVIKDNILLEIKYILDNENCNKTAKVIFGDYFSFSNEKKAKIKIFENLLAETIYCLVDIAQLTETMDETYIFTHYFLGSIHDKLSLWIRRYETYEIYKQENPEIKRHSHIEEYLKQYLDEEWREQLSGYRENQRALSHYYKSLEMHNEGRAYHNMIDTMCYLKDDYNDRSDHFNIAEERHLIVNEKIDKKINAIKDIYKDSKLYKVENYFEKA